MGKLLQAQRRTGKAPSPAAKAARSAAKKTARQDATLYNPSEILQGRDLRGAVNSLVKLQTAPEIKAADRTAREARAVGGEQIRRSNVYGDQLDKTQTDNYALQSALKDKATARMDAISTQEAAKVDSSGQQAQDAWAKDASVRGQGLEGGGEAAVAAATQAASNRQGLNALAYRSAGEASGDAGLQLALASRDVSMNRSKETAGTLENRTQAAVNDALVKKQDAMASRGGLATQLALKMRGDEFEKLATVQGLGLKRDTLAADASQADARIKATLAGQKLSAATSRANNANTNATSSANNANTNATSSANNAANNSAKAQDRASRESIAAAKLAAAGARKGKGRDAASKKAGRAIQNISTIYAQQLSAKKPRPAIARLLRGRYKAPPDLLNAGADIANFGYILPVHVQALKSGGIKVPSKWLKATKAKPAKLSPSERAPGGT